MQEGEDIFAVLNRFQYSLKVNNIPQNEHLRALPAVLTGQFKDAYYNNIDCLNSFPLKYRPGGSKSVTQWFNMWTYKFSVMLNGMPFLDNLSEAAIDNIAKIFATTSVAAGLPNDIRDTVFKTYTQLSLHSCKIAQHCVQSQTLSHGITRINTLGHSHHITVTIIMAINHITVTIIMAINHITVTIIMAINHIT